MALALLLDSKWLDGRKGLLTDLVAAIQDDSSSELDFYQRCGLKAPPLLVRMRVLDQALRARVGGVGDITAPVEDLAGLNLPVSHVFIVENLRTGLVMSDMPGAVVFMRFGYNVDVLARLPWLHGTDAPDRARAATLSGSQAAALGAKRSLGAGADRLDCRMERVAATCRPHLVKVCGALAIARCTSP